MFVLSASMQRAEFERDRYALELQRLQAEHEALKQNASADRLRLEEKLDAEIARNRTREDELVGIITSKFAGGREAAPRHPEDPSTDPETAAEQESVDAEFERKLEYVAKQFEEQAEERGVQYDDEMRTRLRYAIRQDPGQYGLL